MDDGGEGVGVEAGSADEGAVDVIEAAEGAGVVGLDRAAVEDAGAGGGAGAGVLGDLVADDAWASSAISGVAVRPVPMAQTGS